MYLQTKYLITHACIQDDTINITQVIMRGRFKNLDLVVDVGMAKSLIKK
jgi:hypothetical protein